VAFVLGEDHDAQQPRVGQVGEGEVDQAVVAAEGHGRLCAVKGQRQKAFAFSPCEDYGQHSRHKATLVLRQATFAPFGAGNDNFGEHPFGATKGGERSWRQRYLCQGPMKSLFWMIRDNEA